MSPTASIIIPAHNESSSITRGLNALLSQARSEEFDIVVVCNGCTDDTAAEVRRFGRGVRVVEIDEASKTAALNAGDQSTDVFPRVYLDADVVVETESMREVLDTLGSGRVQAAAPTMALDFIGTSVLVRAYYRVWLSTPYCQDGLMGVGFTGLTQPGRRRFDRHPDVICDDEYVRLHFRQDERKAVPSAIVTVRPPTTLGDLIRVKARSRLGWYELLRRYPDLVEARTNDYSGAVRTVLRKPRMWPALPVYLYVNIAARIKAKAQLPHLESYVWERDESSRH